VRDVEIKYGLSATGVVSPERLMTNQQARPGDALVLSKPLGNRLYHNGVQSGWHCPADVLQTASQSMAMLNASVSQAAALECGAKAATDITGIRFGWTCQ
jgi:selenide,water dikinase